MQKKFRLSDGMLSFRENYSWIRIRASDIFYIEAMSDYVKIFMTTDGVKYTPNGTMKEIVSELSQEGFSRTHRSHIINLKHVKESKGSWVTLKVENAGFHEQISKEWAKHPSLRKEDRATIKKVVPIGRAYKNPFRRSFLGQNSIRHLKVA